MTKYLNLNLDETLGGEQSSDTTISSQKAIKTYVDTTIAGTSYSTQNPQLTPVEGYVTWTVTHNLDTKNVLCNVYQGDEEVEVNVETTSDNVVTIRFRSNITIPAGTYTVTIVTSGGIGTSGGGGSYVLPTASTSTLGGVKIDGTTITIDANGVISGSANITVDSALSATSTNPVQNKVIYEALGNIEAILATI